MNEEEKNIQAATNVEKSQDSIVSAIVNSETREADSQVEGAKQEKADFTAMFGVQSEETTEEKELAKETSTDIPYKLEIKDEDREVKIELSAEEKKANHKKNFNSDERLIYQIEEEKNGNPLVVLFFFLALITVIIILPSITKKIDFSSLFKTTPVNNNKNEGEEDDGFLRIDLAASRGKIGELEMINFSKNLKDGIYSFSFTIQNVGDSMYQFNKKYYVVFYDKDNPLYYALIHSYNGIPAKSAEDVTLIINQRVYEKATRFRLEEIVESKYPEVNLNSTEGEYRVLTCKYRNDEMKYYFIDNQLMKITELYRESNTEKDYAADKEKFQSLTETYKNIDYFDSTFVEDSDSFSQINEIDLHNVENNQIIALKTYRFFSYRTEKNTVAFELQGQGYTCS